MAGDDSNSSAGAEDTELDPGGPAIRPRRSDTLAEKDTPFASSDAEDFDELLDVDAKSYAVGDEIARGGMGRIFEGRDRRAGRTVAIKQVLAELLRIYSDDEREIMLRRFEREARITVGLQHPSIIPVYEIGRFGDSPFLAMKRVIGEPLDAVIDSLDTMRERLSVLPKLIAVADALAYAHERGVIHRDLKPANILVGAHGETVVIDWGLAKQLDVEDDDDSAPSVVDSDDGLKTVAGSVFGTPMYMPPEQARGAETDRRADVYALGAILYHLFVGAPPYRKAGKKQRAGNILEQLRAGPPPPVVQLQPELPADLSSIVEKAMARDPDHRYADAGELAADLRHFQSGKLVGVHAYSAGELLRRWIRRHRAAVVTGLVALALLATLGGLAVARIIKSDAASRQAAELAQDSEEKARASAERAIRLYSAGGQKSFARGEYTDALFALTQASILGQPDEEVDLMLGALEDSVLTVDRLGRDVSVMSRQAPAGADVFAIAGNEGFVEIYNKHTAAMVHRFDTGAPVSQVTITRDGERVVVRSDNGKVSAWDPAAKKRLLRYPCRKGAAQAASISSDGKYVVVLCPSMEITLFDANTGNKLHTDQAFIGVKRMIITADSSAVLLVDDNAVSAYSLPELHKIGAGSFKSVGVSEVSSRNLIAHTVAYGRITLVDLRGGSQWRLGEGACLLSTLSGDTSTIACSGLEGDITVFDAASRAILRKIPVGSAPLKRLVSNADGSLIASVADDDVIRVWDVRSGRLRSRHVGATELNHVSFIGPLTLAALDKRQGVLLVRSSGDLVAEEHVLAGAVTNLVYSPEGEQLWISDSTKVALIARSAGGGRISLATTTTSRHGNPMGGSFVVSNEGVFDIKTGERRWASPTLDAPVNRAALSADGTLAMFASLRVVAIVDTVSGEELYRYTASDELGVIAGATLLLGQQRQAVVSSSEGEIHLVDLERKTIIGTRSVAGLTRGLYSLAADRLLISTGIADQLVELPSMKKLSQFRGRSFDVAPSSDGAFFVRLFRQHVEVFDGRTGEMKVDLIGFGQQALAVGVGQDLVLISTRDGEIFGWSLSSGRMLVRHRAGAYAYRLAVAPDDSEYAIPHEERALIYKLPTRQLSNDQLVETLRAAFSTQDFNDRFHLRVGEDNKR